MFFFFKKKNLLFLKICNLLHKVSKNFNSPPKRAKQRRFALTKTTLFWSGQNSVWFDGQIRRSA